MTTNHTATVLPVRPDTFLTTVALSEIELPQRVCEVFALRLGRRHANDVEVLTEHGTWRTVRPGQRLRVEQDRLHALNVWPPLGGCPEELLRAARERAAREDAA